MVVHRLRVVAVALLCGCVLAVAGCGGPGTTTTTWLMDTGVSTTTEPPTVSTTTEPPTVTTETVQLYRVQVDGMWGFIDETGAISIQPAFDSAYCGFSDGLAPVDPTGDDGYRFGYIDTAGDMVIEPRFLSAEPFSDGIAAVGTQDQGDGGKWGAIDTSGALVVPMQYETPPVFSEGRAAVRLAGAWYFIDKRGVAVLGPFESAGSFSKGLACVDRGTNTATSIHRATWPLSCRMSSPAKIGRRRGSPKAWHWCGRERGQAPSADTSMSLAP